MTANWIKKLEHDREGRRILEQERLILEVTEAIATLLADQKVSRSELASRIGTSPAFVTKLLRGDNNFTLRTLSDVFFAMDRAAHLSIGDIGGSAVLCAGPAPKPLRLDSTAWGRTRGAWAEGAHRPSPVSRDSEGIAA